MPEKSCKSEVSGFAGNSFSSKIDKFMNFSGVRIPGIIICIALFSTLIAGCCLCCKKNDPEETGYNTAVPGSGLNTAVPGGYTPPTYT